MKNLNKQQPNNNNLPNNQPTTHHIYLSLGKTNASMNIDVSVGESAVFQAQTAIDLCQSNPSHLSSLMNDDVGKNIDVLIQMESLPAIEVKVAKDDGDDGDKNTEEFDQWLDLYVRKRPFSEWVMENLHEIPSARKYRRKFISAIHCWINNLSMLLFRRRDGKRFANEMGLCFSTSDTKYANQRKGFSARFRGQTISAKALESARDFLLNAGLLKKLRSAKWSSTGKGQSSVYGPTDLFVGQWVAWNQSNEKSIAMAGRRLRDKVEIREGGIKLDYLVEELTQIKLSQAETEWFGPLKRRKREFIKLDPTRPDVHQMRSELVAFNKMNLSHKFQIEASIGGKFGYTLPGENLATIEPLFMNYSRTFSGGAQSLDKGGRFYNQLSASLLTAEREFLRIDGSPVANLDFNGLHLRLAAIEFGEQIRNLNGDVYAIPGIDSLEGGRSLVKMIVNTLLNNQSKRWNHVKSALESENGPIRKARKKLAKKLLLVRKFRGRDSAKVVLREVKKSNKYIPKKYSAAAVKSALKLILDGFGTLGNKAFGTGWGNRAMYIESQITAEIMRRCTERDLPILQIHDGNLCADYRMVELKAIMLEAVKLVTGLDWPESVVKCELGGAK